MQRIRIYSKNQLGYQIEFPPFRSEMAEQSSHIKISFSAKESTEKEEEDEQQIMNKQGGDEGAVVKVDEDNGGAGWYFVRGDSLCAKELIRANFVNQSELKVPKFERIKRVKSAWIGWDISRIRSFAHEKSPILFANSLIYHVLSKILELFPLWNTDLNKQKIFTKQFISV